MATGDKLVSLDGLKAMYDKVDGDVGVLKSAFGNTIQKQIAFVQTANSTTSNYYKTFNMLSAEKCYLLRLTVETAGTYTLRIGTGQSSSAMVDTVGTATVQANVPFDFIGYVPSLSTFTTSRLSVATPHTIAIYEIINISSAIEGVDAEIGALESATIVYKGTLANNSDLNDIAINSRYILSSNNTYTNAPNMPGGGYVLTMPTNSGANVRSQYALDFNSGNIFYRHKIASGWGDWAKITDSAGIDIPTKYVAFGDSTILGAVWDYDQTTQWYTAGTKYQIPTRIAHAIGMDSNFANEAVGGTGFYEQSSAGASVTEKILAYDFTGVEIVTICAGINDKGNASHPMGTATNPAEGTICYAVKQIIDFFSQNYPAVQVIFIQPLPAGNLADPWGGTYAAGWSQNDFDEQVGTLCHNEHVGYVNWWESNICKQYASFSGGYSYNPNTGKLTGPNYSHMATEIDYAKLGDFIAGKVSALFHGRN